jgi:energy-coupling factor transport system ATP-binding protein
MDIVAEYAKWVVVLNEGEKLCEGPPREVFSQIKLLETAYLKPPMIFSLFHALNLPPVLTVDEAYNFIKKVT